ncbi:MAG: lamin tail domain-containing protein [Bacteroidales bacterium]|nr:lamin tail domain-containing protein [Bacteroidales bacterium]
MKKLFMIACVAVAAFAFVSCGDEEINKDKVTYDYTKLIINEVNATAEVDLDKFVEFYNTGDKEISLEGVVIKRTDENNETGEVWLGLATEKVPAKGFFVIQGTKNSGDHSLSSGVSAKKGVKLEVFDPNGKSITSVQHGILTDATAKPAIQTGIWARIPEGGAWKNVTNATPGAANDATGAQADAELI